MQVHGHRGCRGLLPENTLVAFQKALELGVDTLEMDVCISKDLQVVVSHEPWFNHEISTQANGEEITIDTEKSFNLFQLNYHEIKQFDVGLKPHPRFSTQTKMAAHKPLLSDVIALAEAYSNKTIHYNIEIKYSAAESCVYHPDVKVFSDLVMELLLRNKIEKRTIVQCFEPSVLNYIHTLNPQQQLSYLVEDDLPIDVLFEKLTFTPQVYSPDFSLLSSSGINYCHNKNILVIPWTANKEIDMTYLINMGVDGIISDYPDVLLNVLKQQN